MTHHIKGEMVKQQEIAPGVFYLEVLAPEIAQKAQPGQFVHVRCSPNLSPLLRRPLSLHGIQRESGKIALLYQVKGAGTQILAQKRPGEALDILGPLGRGFTLDPKAQNILIVGGGLGVAPLLPLAEFLQEKQQAPTVILGFNTSSQVLRLREFEAVSQKLYVTTVDGSAGEKGLVTVPLKRELEEKHYDLIYACGPEPMLKTVAELATSLNIKCQVSLETFMACGIGACFGCTCKTQRAGQEEYARVCVEGPVFDSQVVVWHG